MFNGDGTFVRITCNSGASDTGATIGVAYADYDQDGWVDLLIGNHVEGYRLLRNRAVARDQHHWLSVELVGGGNVNRDAVGSRVYVQTGDGRTQMQEVVCGSSVGSGNELILHFGLGKHTAVSELTVRWPDNLDQIYRNVAGDQKIVLHYPHEALE